MREIKLKKYNNSHTSYVSGDCVLHVPKYQEGRISMFHRSTWREKGHRRRPSYHGKDILPGDPASSKASNWCFLNEKEINRERCIVCGDLDIDNKLIALYKLLTWEK